MLGLAFWFAGDAAMLMLVQVLDWRFVLPVLVLGRRFVLPVLAPCWCWRRSQ